MTAALTVLAGLADKSLLRMDSTGRYDLHELLRQYAGEKLAEADEIRATTQRYLIYFMKLAEAGETHAYGREQAIWYDRQEVEMDNLRAALVWSISNKEAEIGLRIAAALRWVWERHGHLEEGLTWFNKLLPYTSVEGIAPGSTQPQCTHPPRRRHTQCKRSRIPRICTPACRRPIQDSDALALFMQCVRCLRASNME
jgi:hypothetical protein